MHCTFCYKGDVPILACHEHSHENWEIVLQTSGTAQAVIRQKVYNMAPGDIMVIPPGTPHSEQASEPYTDMYLQADHLGFSELLLLHDDQGELYTLISLIHKTMTEKERYYTEIADALLTGICLMIKRLSAKSSRYPFITEFKGRLYQNIANADFNIAEQIHSMGYNTDYFRRCFKEEFDQTPLEYLLALRISQAKNLLLQASYLHVSDIAQKCGFNDSFYFSKCFKKLTGISPKHYRQKYKDGVPCN